MAETWWCTVCARPVAATTMGIAGRLGYCTHGPSDDDKPRLTRLVPVVSTQAEAEVLREQKLDRAALRRAQVKSHTEDGRKTLTSREARMLAGHNEARD